MSTHKQKVKVLLLEDSPTDARLVQLDLSQAQGYHFVVDVAVKLTDALAILAKNHFDVVLLDLGLPDSSGIDTLLTIKNHSPDLPLVVLTSAEDESVGLLAIKSGAQDYLIKGSVDGRTISRSIRHAIERMNMEETLKAKIAELDFANRELEAFSYSVSHDVRSPLQNIITFGDMILTEYGDKMDSDGLQMMQYIHQSATRISDITLDLLSLSKISLHEIRCEEVNFSEIAGAVVQELKKNASDRNVEIIIEPDLCVKADPGLSRIMIENLIRNSWKFTSKKTTAVIEFGFKKNPGTDCYFVKDNGAGFDMSLAKNLFKPFHRLHSDKTFQGTGIGLSIVKRVVDKHGGTIWVESQIDKGTTFYFTFNQDTALAHFTE